MAASTTLFSTAASGHSPVTHEDKSTRMRLKMHTVTKEKSFHLSKTLGNLGFKSLHTHTHVHYTLLYAHNIQPSLHLQNFNNNKRKRDYVIFYINKLN